ncbi:MAG: MFS transporter, partial [Clostridiales bacterium]|nr:MFS transporter [Clostridiales bacterium]
MKDEKIATHWRRNAGFFIAGQFLSLFGSMLVSYAVMWYITITEQSGMMMALFTCAAMLPTVFISPFAGVWADRYNCKHLINLSDAAIAVITLMAALFYSAGSHGILILLAAAMARSIGQGIQQPAVNALIPQIVPDEHLQKFNSINSTAQSLTMFAAPLTANALIFYFPLKSIFFIDVATAAIGIATVFFCVKVLPREKKKERTGGAKAYYQEMMAGLRFINGQPWLKTLFISAALFAVLASPVMTLTSLQVARNFGGDYWRLLTVELAFSVGMMGGGVLIAVWGGFKNKVHTMLLSWLLFGIATFLFGLITDFYVYIGVMAFCGVT